ncbi:hypothetical protein RhiXN_06351 [Rhizoctonia solani]|uniref:Uncharacterized protein n=1 Tax=Rhizoctonia solani TaxID=456999 RepID=A0A8H8P0B6_9AGAM|nr:uncharacterized protein RhiXN_06351 [Rhizoctonia solani]QRW21362.1 hypothetical protein RhiXN_06351 [Rhizoctonia solani]
MPNVPLRRPICDSDPQTLLKAFLSSTKEQDTPVVISSKHGRLTGKTKPIPLRLSPKSKICIRDCRAEIVSAARPLGSTTTPPRLMHPAHCGGIPIYCFAVKESYQ